jgi:hypothetical protein
MATVLELIDAEVEAFDSNVETGSLDSFGVTTRKATTTAKAGGLSVFIPTLRAINLREGWGTRRRCVETEIYGR